MILSSIHGLPEKVRRPFCLDFEGEEINENCCGLCAVSFYELWRICWKLQFLELQLQFLENVPFKCFFFPFSGGAAKKEAALVAEVAAQHQAVMAAVEAEGKQETVSEPSAVSQVSSNLLIDKKYDKVN